MGTRWLLGHVVSWKLAAVGVAVLGLVMAAVIVVRKAAGPPLTVTLHIGVAPPNQLKLVTAYASGARFKYLIGTQAGVRPVLAQKLTIKSAPNTSELEATVGVETKAQAERYAESFVETLQGVCGAE